MGSNLKKLFIALVVPLPAIVFHLSFLNHYEEIAASGRSGDDGNVASSLWSWCFHHPLLLANVLFFFNVNVLFWVIGQLQNNHWMIDLYWTVIPVMLMHFYATHPLAQYNVSRSKIVIILTWIWAIRLTHNYIRREKWEWGAREDWRFNDMRGQYGRNWWWVSFFAVYVSQQVFLIGVCLPLYAVHSVDMPLNIWDLMAVIVAVSGVVIAYFADKQLYEYVTRNEKLKELGKPTVVNLEEGLWFYSRHPNYFGEQIWWWGLGIFAWNLGQDWPFAGALVNTMCLAYVTVLVERRMLNRSYRAEAYRQYQKTTSVWVPWFKTMDGSAKDKTS